MKSMSFVGVFVYKIKKIKMNNVYECDFLIVFTWVM